MKNLKHLLERIDIKIIYGKDDITIKGITDDSREVKEGFLFIAVKGISVNGHDFILEAAKNGAVAVVGEQPPNKGWFQKVTYIQTGDSREALGNIALAWFDHPSRRMKVVGVTGTKGKSTTAYILHHLLENAGKKTGSVTSISAKIGEKEYDTGLHVTNPAPIALNDFLRKMVDSDCEYAVLEVTSHGLDQKRVTGIDFNIGILTNIKHEHLDYHKTFDEYKKAKSKLFYDLDVAVLNKDDESYQFIKNVLNEEVELVSYSMEVDSNFQVGKITSKEKMEFEIIENSKKHKLSTEIIGDFNAMNFAAAVAVARHEGIDWETIKDAVESIKTPPGRLEKIENDKDINIYIDFAHTPDSLKKVLNFLKERHPDGRLISVFGCASERDVLKRPMMGDVSTKVADISIFTAEDPRNEDIHKIIDEIAEGVSEKTAEELDIEDVMSKENRHVFYRIPERGDAITFAINEIAQPRDTVVVCGKGHEKSMSYNGVEYPWSDHDAIKLALKGKVFEIKR